MTETINGRASAASEDLGGALGNTTQTCPRVILEIGVFFDGTLNNAANSLEGGRGGSYANARSNVALLSELYKREQRHWIRNSCGGYERKFASHYVPGPGTVSGGGDDWFQGNGLGMGTNGVESRVYHACLRIGQMVRELSPGVEPTEIIMDVFGFSRGAAAARYFVNCFRQGFIMYDENFVNRQRASLPAGRRVRFRFVGIFDTVAAIGIGTNDDNGPVNVHVSTAQAEKIFHLTAGDEYRENFRLNHNIDRSTRVGNTSLQSGSGGEARELPGAHSDVGGGYRDAGDTVDLGPSRTYSNTSRAAAQSARDAIDGRPLVGASDFWVRQGWINANETEGGTVTQASAVRTRPMFSRTGNLSYLYEYTVTPRLHRPWVQIGLSRIALRIMYDKAVAQSVPFTAFPSGGEYAVPPGLRPVAAKLIAGQSLTGDEYRSTLRNFGHVSSNVGSVGMSPEPNFVRVIYPNRSGQAR